MVYTNITKKNINKNIGLNLDYRNNSIKYYSTEKSKYQNKELMVIDEIKLPSLKTKELKTILVNLKLGNKVLFVTSDENENLYMATRNLKNVGHIMANELNVLDITNCDTLVIDEASVKYVEEVLK